MSGLAQLELHAVGARGHDLLDVGEERRRGVACLGGQRPAQRGDHVGRREGRPILERHAFAQLEREQPVAIAVSPASGQVGYQLQFGVVLDELVIDQPERLEIEEVRYDVGVELLHARRVADNEGAARCRVHPLNVSCPIGRGRRRRRHPESYDQTGSSRQRSRARAVTFPDFTGRPSRTASLLRTTNTPPRAGRSILGATWPDLIPRHPKRGRALARATSPGLIPLPIGPGTIGRRVLKRDERMWRTALQIDLFGLVQTNDRVRLELGWRAGRSRAAFPTSQGRYNGRA